MPLVRSNLYPGPLSLGAAPVDCIVDGDVVFQRIGACDIVIVRIPGTPDQPASLIFLSRNSFEFDFDESVLQVGIFFDAHGIRRLTRLLKHVRLARRSVIFFHGPFRLARSGLCRGPAGRRFADLKSIEIDRLGKQGDFKDQVLKVNIPRNDVQVTVAGVATPTPFGFGGWIAMTKASDGNQVMMGDLVLLQDEVNPVMSALLNAGLDVTALHNHFFFDEPRMFYMHVHGHGSTADLTKRIKPALDLIGASTKGAQPPASSAAGPPLDTAKLAEIVGHMA